MWLLIISILSILIDINHSTWDINSTNWIIHWLSHLILVLVYILLLLLELLLLLLSVVILFVVTSTLSLELLSWCNWMTISSSSHCPICLIFVLIIVMASSIDHNRCMSQYLMWKEIANLWFILYPTTINSTTAITLHICLVIAKGSIIMLMLMMIVII